MSEPTPRASLAQVIEIEKVRRAKQAAGSGARRGILYWTAALVTAANATSGATFAVLAVVASQGHSQAALHAAARSLPLAVASWVLVAVFTPAGLCTLTTVLAFVQLLDFVAGIVAREPVVTGVSLLFTVLTMACAIPVLGEQVNRRPNHGG